MSQYENRVAQQIAQYAHVENIHDLPECFHRWSGLYVAAGLVDVFEANSVASFYLRAIKDVPAIAPKIFSIGCGDGSLEIEIAKLMLHAGYCDFEIVGSDLSPILIDRFKSKLEQIGLEQYFHLSVSDLNATDIPGSFDVVIANHVLHHVLALETLFAAIKTALTPNGILATNDMIGRNGHMRWPEVAAFVHAYWQYLRPEQRYNLPLKRPEPVFIDHDCSTEGFEGVRAQDILPLLLGIFHPKRFFATGGLIDVFVDRCYGHGFQMDRKDDRSLIDNIGAVNDLLLDSGLIKPTIMFGHFTNEQIGEEHYYRSRKAQFCVRRI